MKQWLRRGELAKVLETTVPTIKYYTNTGLLIVQKKTDHGQYLYDLEQSRQRFSRIKELKEKRFTIQEIKDRLQIDILLED